MEEYHSRPMSTFSGRTIGPLDNQVLGDGYSKSCFPDVLRLFCSVLLPSCTNNTGGGKWGKDGGGWGWGREGEGGVGREGRKDLGRDPSHASFHLHGEALPPDIAEILDFFFCSQFFNLFLFILSDFAFFK